jgi:hypothetical protein
MMNIFTKPYWIYLTLTVPQGVIFLYYFELYSLFSSQLGPKNLEIWANYAITLSLMMILATLYAGFMQFRHRTIHWQYGLVATPSYLTVLYLFYTHDISQLLPNTIQSWMFSATETLFLPIGLTMPILIHTLLLFVERTTPTEQKRSLLPTVIGAITIPTIWYLMMRLPFPLLKGELNGAILEHLQVLTFIILTVTFMFLLIRLAYQLALKLPDSYQHTRWFLKLMATTLLPLASLLVYNGVVILPNGHRILVPQLIGDWSDPIYYALVLIIGIALILPHYQQHSVRFVLFLVKALVYPIVVYFFIVFLPFFPLALSSIVFFGLGFLLLSPLLLFFYHTWSLCIDWKVLHERFGRATLLLTFIASMVVIPTAVITSYSIDRITLDMMLEHLYEPDYESHKELILKKNSAVRVLEHIRTIKQRDIYFDTRKKPYLSRFYQWLVLDNLTLSERRLNDLERVFLGKSATPMEDQPWLNTEQNAPKITKIKTSTKRSSDNCHYISQVDLTITNHEGGWGLDEYATRFHLPSGAWVSDYYLVIDDKPVPGILSEKKSALWIYQQVTNSSQDPGILYYTSPEELILRVFPFQVGESRQTGFEIIHREAITLEIDDHQIALQPKDQLVQNLSPAEDSKPFHIVSSSDKKRLKPYQRKPYIHFIVDRSSRAEHQLDAFRQRIDELQEKQQLFGIELDNAVISLVNYNSLTLPLSPGWEKEAEAFLPEGGFFLELALKRILATRYWRQSGRYPLFVVLSDQIEEAVFLSGMEDFSITMPEGDEFLLLTEDGEITLHRFSSPLEAIEAKSTFLPASRQVLVWPDPSSHMAYLPDDGQATTVILDKNTDVTKQKLEGNSWDNGAQLNAMWQLSKLDPPNTAQKHRALIRYSFQTRILTPLTAFLSPENELQRKLLLRKQQQVLNSMRPLDVGEEYQMDEPPLWIIALFSVVLILLRRYLSLTQRTAVHLSNYLKKLRRKTPQREELSNTT